jgi:hypothetical protein
MIEENWGGGVSIKTFLGRYVLAYVLLPNPSTEWTKSSSEAVKNSVNR